MALPSKLLLPTKLPMKVLNTGIRPKIFGCGGWEKFSSCKLKNQPTPIMTDIDMNDPLQTGRCRGVIDAFSLATANNRSYRHWSYIKLLPSTDLGKLIPLAVNLFIEFIV